jgi:hypothetical protein
MDERISAIDIRSHAIFARYDGRWRRSWSPMRSIVTVDEVTYGAGPPRDLPIRRIAALGLLI